MTGVERLRKLIEDYRTGHECDGFECTELSCGECMAKNVIKPIADQIERERAEDCHRTGLDHGAVSRVVTDMERHILGHEGMEDSPVARWARELRDALGGEGHDLTDEDREAIAWVREHGGLDCVKDEWRSRVPYDLYERRRQRLLGHIAECETALGRRREIIKELGHRVNDLTTENAELRKRAMPQGCKWPRYEDGESVMFGGFAADAFGTALDEPIFSVELFENGFTLHGDGVQAFYGYEERVRRPAVLAADGKPLREGETVWNVKTGERYVVGAFAGGCVNVSDGRGGGLQLLPSQLTHERPVADSFEQLEKDANDLIYDIGFHLGDYSPSDFKEEGDSVQDRVRDLVRRAKALAEGGE